MLAGSMSDAKELLSACRPHIERHQLGADDLSITRLRQGLTEAVRLRKRDISTSVLSAELGVTYDEVFNWSQAHPDDPTWREAWHRIKGLSLSAELIVGTFTDDEAAILTVESNGRVTWVDHYAAIGTGDNIANAFMTQRAYNDRMTVKECLFKVLEAKTAAEKNPYVGEMTIVALRTPSRIFVFKSAELQKMAQKVRDLRNTHQEIEFTDDDLIPAVPQREQQATIDGSKIKS
jgi:hypothetical protein